MAQFTIYRSTDTSAPVLDGTTGSLITLLDACLVNGYGVQSGAGWNKIFSGTNLAAYQLGTGSSSGVLRINDGAPYAGGGLEADAVGFTGMTHINSGLWQFPTSGSAASDLNGVVWRKSASADTTARPWILAADSRTMYLFVQVGDAASVYAGYCFGEFYSYQRPADNYRYLIVGDYNDNINNANTLDLYQTITTAVGGHYCPKLNTGFGGPVAFGKHSNYGYAGSSSYGAIPFPNPVNGAILLSNVYLHNPTHPLGYVIHGRMRGFYVLLHPITNLSDGDTFSGVLRLQNRTFLAIKPSRNVTSNNGIYIIETSDTLDTN